MAETKLEQTLHKQNTTISKLGFWGNDDQITLINNQLSQVLHHVAHGNETEALQLLTANPNLLCHYGSVTDITGRKFPKISVFQYALWSWDVLHLGKKIFSCLPEGELGRLIKEQMLKQLEELEEQGISYEFNNAIITGEKHFDFNPLIEAYEALIGSFDDFDKSKFNWINVGKAQKALPVSIRNEYCNPDQSFNGNNLFVNDNLKRSLKFFNYVTQKSELWDAKLSGLGETFAIERSAARDKPLGAATATGGRLLHMDYKAILKLRDVRAENLKQVKQSLEDNSLLIGESSNSSLAISQ